MRHSSESMGLFAEKFELRLNEVKNKMTRRGIDWSNDMDITHFHINLLAMRSGALRLATMASQLDDHK